MLLLKLIFLYVVVGFIFVNMFVTDYSLNESLHILFDYVKDSINIRNSVLIIVISIIIVIVEKKSTKYTNEMLKSWAEKNGFDIVSVKKCNIYMGPSIWLTLWNAIYLVEVVDCNNKKSSAWINMGYSGYEFSDPIWIKK